MIRMRVTEYDMSGNITKTEDVQLKDGAAMEKFVEEIFGCVVRTIRFTQDTTVIFMDRWFGTGPRYVYFVGTTDEMIGFAKLAAWVKETCRPDYKEAESILTFRGVSEAKKAFIRTRVEDEFAFWLKGSKPAYVLFRAFGRVGYATGNQIGDLDEMKLETAAAAFALVLDEGITLEEALAMAKN